MLSSGAEIMKTITVSIARKLFLATACCGVALVCGCATLDQPLPEAVGNDLQSGITQRLAMDPMTAGSVYGVEVSGGQVVIRGIVHSEAERMRVLGLVRGTPGVTGVTDHLRVLR